MAHTIILSETINKCYKCSNCRESRDPDPNDWFCQDDLQLICAAKNDKIIEGCLRPYEVKDVEIPDWCPLIP